MNLDDETRDLSGVHGCIFHLHGDGTLLDVNFEAARLFRLSKKRSIGQPFQDLRVMVEEGLAEDLKEGVQAYMGGQKHLTRLEDSKGETYTLEIRPIEIGIEVDLKPGNEEETVTFPPSAQVSAVHSESIMGKYRLENQIGKGGMGKVYSALDAFDNQVAVKVLIAGEFADEKELQRFRREGVIMSRLNHRNICRIIEMGEHLGRRYISMEYIDGNELAAMIGDQGLSLENIQQLPSINETLTSIQDRNPSRQRIKRILRLFLDILEGINYAHQFEVIHRDLKPANIMIRKTGEPVVMDFGLAKYHNGNEDLQVSMSGEVMGTIEYIAPEQAAGGKDVDVRADIYSASAMLYYMLTGKKKLKSSGNLYEDLEILKEQIPRPPSQFNPDISEDLDIVIMKGLAIDPHRRYENVRAMATDLQAIIDDMPITARKESLTDRIWRQVRKHKRVSAAIVVIFLLFTVMLTYHFLSMRESLNRFLRAEEAAQIEREKAGQAIGQLKKDMTGFMERREWTEAKIKALEILTLDGEDVSAMEALGTCDLEIMKKEHPIPSHPPSGHPKREELLMRRLNAWLHESHQSWAEAHIAKLKMLLMKEREARESFLQRFPEYPILFDEHGPYFDNSVGLRMRFIPPGTFLMGDTLGTSLREIEMEKEFFISETEITQEQWLKLLQYNPAKPKVPNHPVNYVPWNGALLYAEELNRAEGYGSVKTDLPGREHIREIYSRGVGYRLPTEAEWEYACRADIVGLRFHWLDGDAIPSEAPLWFRRNTGKNVTSRTSGEVGVFPANPWGLKDMHGNVFEWTLDTYDEEYPNQTKNPVVLEPEGEGVVRGGFFRSSLSSCRAGYRQPFQVDIQDAGIGFRLVLLPKKK